MWMTLLLWVCSLVLIALVVVPLFGWKIAGLTAAALFGALLLVCLGICSGGGLGIKKRGRVKGAWGFISGKEVMRMAKDPVCGMEVDEKKAAATAEHRGKKYYFCAAGCKATFLKNPEKYISSQSPSGTGHGHGH